MSASQCARTGCENPLPIKEPGTRGRPYRFCSRQCGKRACEERHRKMCPDCGQPMSLGSNWRNVERCRECHEKREALAMRAKLEDVACMYREGMSYREISHALGYSGSRTPPEITFAFRAGILTDADRRYSKTRAENTREARWGRAA